MIMNRTSPPMLALIPAQVMKIKTNYFSDLKLCNSKILINVKKILYPQKKKIQYLLKFATTIFPN